MKKSTIFIVLGLLCLNFKSLATQISEVVPLKIGDEIPSALSKLTLVNEISASKNKAFTLKSLSKRLIILDFWGQYCAPCIQALPEYDKINSLNTTVQIIGVSDFKDGQALKATLKKLKVNLVHTPTLLSSKLLNEYFPHKLIPHAVWILDNKVYAITAGEYIKPENIDKILTQKTQILTNKFEAEDLRPTTLLSYLANGSSNPKKIFYSAFSTSVEGIASPTATVVDSIAGTQTVSYFNISLMSFCRLAIENKSVYNVQDFMLSVRDSSKLYYNNKGYYQEWKRSNSYCYTIVLPLTLSTAERQDYIREDITRWLKLMGIQTGKFPGTLPRPYKYWIKEEIINDGRINQTENQ